MVQLGKGGFSICILFQFQNIPRGIYSLKSGGVYV